MIARVIMYLAEISQMLEHIRMVNSSLEQDIGKLPLQHS